VRQKISQIKTNTHHKHHLRAVLLAAMAVLAFGTLGYVWVEGWGVFDALYMVIITVTTVGYGEVHPLTAEGRLVSMIIILCGIGLATYSLSTFASFILEGGLKKSIIRRHMRDKIKHLRNHYIVCGLGDMGVQVASGLESEGIAFVVVDNDEEIEEGVEAKGWLFIHGDANDPEVLKEAGLEESKGVILTLGEDAHNVFAALSIKTFDENKYVVSRANSPLNEAKMYQAGVDKVVVPYRLMSSQIVNEALRPKLNALWNNLMDVNNKEMCTREVYVLEDCMNHGKAINEVVTTSTPRVSVLVLEREDGSSVVNPSYSEVLAKGDRLVLFGKYDDVKNVGEKLGARVGRKSVI